MADLLAPDPTGLACPSGGFTIDPVTPVRRAVITHAHADHLSGVAASSPEIWCAAPSAPLLRKRLGPDARIVAVPYGERVRIGSADVSFHPAGHVLGSAQVCVEAEERWVVSGDYKRAPDPTCAPFEPLACDVFVTEATFALPIYRWDPPDDEIAALYAWWEENRAAGRASVLLGYGLGKCQRVLAGLRAHTDREVWVHGAVEPIVRLYREAGVEMLPTRLVAEDKRRGEAWAGELVLAPPGWEATPWIRRFGQARVALASGFMRVRGNRRRRGVDRGFALSDHADWPDLLRTIDETGARRVLVTHGYVDPLVRWLREHGRDAAPLRVGWTVEERPGTAESASPAGS